MIVFTYPGQGSQAPGMGSAWVDHPSWELVEEASDATSRDIAALLLDTDKDELTMTRNAQLATFVTSMVSWLDCDTAPPASVATISSTCWGAVSKSRGWLSAT